MSKESDMAAALAHLEVQIEREGVAVAKVDDGEVFVFTEGVLERLLLRARANGRVMVFVKIGKLASELLVM